MSLLEYKKLTQKYLELSDPDPALEDELDALWERLSEDEKASCRENG